VTSTVSARRVPGDHPDAVRLVEAMVAEVAALYGPRDERSPSATPDELSPPHGTFVLLVDDGRAVAGGGVKRLADGLGEIKRMYVVPEARGRRLARRLLDELETAARELGYRRVRLDTGARQPHARALYESAGYQAIDNYNGNPWAAFWGEKQL
jgi:GNAT superfamily N-acetyltransferase